MGLREELITLNNSPIAKTNILDIKGDLLANIEQLLMTSDTGVYVTYNASRFKKGLEEEAKTFEQRIHREIKQLIRKELSLTDDAAVRYETCSSHMENDYKKVYFFYLSPIQTEPAVLLAHLKSESINRERIFQALISLHLKCELIAQAQIYYDLEPEYFNSRLYLGAELKDKPNKAGKTQLDALYPDIYFSDQHELIATIHQKSFLSMPYGQMTAELEDASLLFRNSQGSYKVTDEINAIRFSNKVFVAFDQDYRLCTNHAQNTVMNILKRILSRNKISYDERFYQADYALDGFLTAEKNFYNPLVIIDDLGDEYTAEQRSYLYSQLTNHYPSAEVAFSEQYLVFESFSKDKNYLVLNQSSSKNGSSIKADDESLNTFWGAYKLHKYGKGENLDYYSRLKIALFDSKREIVLQGLNIDRLMQNKKDKETGKTHVVYKPVSEHKLNRIRTELWLKEAIMIDHRLAGISLPDSTLTLIYIRKLKSKSKREDFFGSVVDVVLTGSELIVKSQQTFVSEQRLIHHCPYLGTRKGKLFNGSFYIFDSDEQVFLSSYNSIRVPQIIGNRLVDNIAMAEANDGKLRRLTAIEETPLPYYLVRKERKQYHHIYLQELDNDLLCFVSRLNTVKPKVDKQNLIYNILTFDTEGNLLKALDQSVTEIYLKSFTEDILRLNEVSKSSLLEKVAKLYIEN